MRFFASLFLVFVVTLPVFAQQNEGGSVARNNGAEGTKVETPNDQEAYQKAVTIEDHFERIKALKAFIEEFTDSALRVKAFESLVSARAAAADEKLRAKDSIEAVRLFTLAVKEAPEPISDDLFSKILVNIPINLFVLNQRDAAFDIANMLESRSGSNAKQLLRLATFYFSIKYATGARRLVEKAKEITPEDPLVFQSLGAAYRLGFDLQGASDAYARALQLDPGSISIRQNLADMKRATGESLAAEKLFREILVEKPLDIEANTGLILSLFDQGKKGEAERLLEMELTRNPSNAFVLIGAAHWYAANGNPDTAIEYAEEAVNLDESAVWGFITMGRAFMKKGDPVNAEKSLVAAARLSAAPTIAYELALAQVASGFYRDAGEVLREFFVIEKGQLVTDLDGRIGVEADNFADLISLERKSFLFSPTDGYDRAEDAQLKALLTFENVVESETAQAADIEAASSAFIDGDDAMRTYRQLYVANKLLDNGKSPDVAAQIARDAIKGVEKSVDVALPAAPVMADQLYAGRREAAAAGRLIVVPDVEKSTLLGIMRGKIEEISARSVMASGDFAAAQIKLKRALTVFPADSAWWRSSMWRLGTVYEKQGDDRNALASYAASYSNGDTTPEKRKSIEAVYQRVNGSLTGLEDLLANKKTVQVDAASRFTKEPLKAKSVGKTTVTDGDNETIAASSREGNAEIKSSNRNPAESALIKVAVAGTQSARATPLAEDVDLTVAKSVRNSASVPVVTLNPELPVATEARVEKPLVTDPEITAAQSKSPLTLSVADIEKPLENEVAVEQPSVVDPPVVEPTETDIPAEQVSVVDPPVTTPTETDIPADQASVVDSPVVESTETDVPAEQVSVVAPPVVESTETDVPAEQPPVVDPPVVESTETDIPAEQASVVDSPVVESTETDIPAEQASVVDPPVVESTETDVPVEQALVVDPPVVESTETDVPVEQALVVDPPLPAEMPVDLPTGSPLETESPTTASAAELIDLGATRPRFVAPDKIRAKPDSCSVVVSQDSVSIISNGGSFGIVVGVEDYTQAYVLRAKSGSAEDVSITFEPDIGSVDGRAFFMIKSISQRTGIFDVFFETPCGNKIIKVEVY